jgi:RNA polymerase sigma-70 factor (ECF subfamily)
MAHLDTSLSFLERLMRHDDDEAWRQFSALYEPLIRRWVGRLVSQPDAVDDIAQEVLTALIEGLPSFQHNLHKGAFRAWLKSITIHRIRRYWRDQRPTAEQLSQASDLEDPDSALSRLWDDEHNRHVVESLLERVLRQFDTKTREIIRRVVGGDCSPKEVAAEFGCSVNAVYIAKARALNRLRLEGRGLLE